MSVKPELVTGSFLRERVETPDGGFTTVSGVDPKRIDSSLWFGSATFKPGAEEASWTSLADTHEGYFVIKGTLTIRWEGESEGSEEVGAGQFFYFAPNFTYRLVNTGDADAEAIWAVTPPPPSAWE